MFVQRYLYRILRQKFYPPIVPHLFFSELWLTLIYTTWGCCHKSYILSGQLFFWENILVKYQKNFNNSYFISPLQGNLTFIWTHFKAVKLRMLCSYFNWNRLSSSGEDENAKSLRYHRRRQIPDKFWLRKNFEQLKQMEW